jgi:hypothetical protein
MQAGERHLVVQASSEAAFRRTLRELGYLLSAGGTRPARNRRPNRSDDAVPQAPEA